MTNLQAFLLKVGKDITNEDAEALLEFNGIDPNGVWNANDKSVKCPFYGAVLGYLDQSGVGITQVSEGGYSITYDRDAKAKYIERLANESGCPDLIKKYRTGASVTFLKTW